MEPVVLALASNERFFPGLYCAVASALSHLDPTRGGMLKRVVNAAVPDSETL
jgi:hypothetical protein